MLQEAGVKDADLLIACTSRDEINIIAAMLARALSPRTKTIVRTSNRDYLEAWQEHHLDVDFTVSSEQEAAYAVWRIIGVPAALETEVFADGQVQIVEFDVHREIRPGIVGVPLRDAHPGEPRSPRSSAASRRCCRRKPSDLHGDRSS